MKKQFFAPVFVFLFLSMACSAFGWGSRSHPPIGGNATDWQRGSLFLNANNGPDICHLILRDVEFAHSEIEFAEMMVEVARKAWLPWVRERRLNLAYGWGSHIMADDIAHKQMLLGFDTIEHGIAELAIDWWLWHNGSFDERLCARNATVAWSSWLVYETSRRYGEGIIWPGEVDAGGFLLALVIAGETVIMLDPCFYIRAESYSENTGNLLKKQAWKGYYESAIVNAKSWLPGEEAAALAPSRALAKDKKGKPGIKHEVLREIGERAIELGGIKKVVDSDEYSSQITLIIEDQSLCKKALREIVSKKLKTAQGKEKKFMLLLLGDQRDVKKSAVKLGEIKTNALTQ